MYYYIANPTENKQEQNFFSVLRQKLTAEGIAGEIEFCSPGADAVKLATQALAKGFTTIVVVGDDLLASKVAGALIDQPVALGIIPQNASQSLISLLGYSQLTEAIQALRHRKLGLYDIGVINEDIYFLSRLTIDSVAPIEFVLHVNQFSATFTGQHLLIDLFNEKPPLNISGVLHFIAPGKNKIGWFGRPRSVQEIETLLRAEQAVLQTSEIQTIKMAETSLTDTPVSFGLIPQAVRLITARQSHDEPTKVN